MSGKDIHETVDIEKIEHKSVEVIEKWDDGGVRSQLGPAKRYKTTYSLPIAVSTTWQEMFHKPDPTSGIVHQVNFEFSEDAKTVSSTLDNEPAPELLMVLKRYAERANRRWEPFREKLVNNQEEEERILRKLKGIE